MKRTLGILLGIIILALLLDTAPEGLTPAQAETIPAGHLEAFLTVLVGVPHGERALVDAVPPVLVETRVSKHLPEPVDIPEPTLTPEPVNVPEPVDIPEPVIIPEPTPEPVDTCPGAGHCWAEPGPHPSPAAPWADPTPEPEQPGQQNQRGGQG